MILANKTLLQIPFSFLLFFISSCNTSQPINNMEGVITSIFEKDSIEILSQSNIDYMNEGRNPYIALSNKSYIKVEKIEPIKYPYYVSINHNGNGRLISNVLKCTQNRSWAVTVRENVFNFIYLTKGSTEIKTESIKEKYNPNEWYTATLEFVTPTKIQIWKNGKVIHILNLPKQLNNPNQEFVVASNNCAITQNNYSESWSGKIGSIKIVNGKYDVNSKSTNLNKLNKRFEFADKSSIDAIRQNRIIQWKINKLNSTASKFILKSNNKIIDTVSVNKNSGQYQYILNEDLISEIEIEIVDETNKSLFKSKSLQYNSQKYKAKQIDNIHYKEYTVTNSNNSGPGSLRYALNLKYPRKINFDLDGVISIKTDLKISNPYVVLDGKSPNGQSITIVDSGIQISTHNVTIKNLAIRPMDGNSENPNYDVRDAISILGSNKRSSHETYNILIDHCSLSWATDENISLWYDNIKNVTISNCIIAEGLYRSKHSKGGHSKGLIVGPGSKNIFIYNNLFYSNHDRNPLITGGCDVIVANNYIYNCGSSIKIYDKVNAGKINAIVYNNIIETKSNNKKLVFEDTENHNIVYSEFGSNLNVADQNLKLPTDLISELNNIPFHSKKDLKNIILNTVGATPSHRSKTDRRIINTIKNKTFTKYVDQIHNKKKKSNHLLQELKKEKK